MNFNNFIALPTADISICSESGTAFLGISIVTLIDVLFVFLRSKKVALFTYCVSPSAYINKKIEVYFQLI